VVLLATVVVAGCGPQVVLVNKTRSPLRFSVTTPGSSSVTTVQAGEEVAVEIEATGPYTVGIVRSDAWVKMMEAQRDDYVNSLANPNNLTPSDLAATVANIDALTTRIDALLRNPLDARCSGTVTTKSDGEATASTPAGATTATPSLACAAIPAADPGFLDIPFIGSPF
jgi:hypothetical protein